MSVESILDAVLDWLDGWLKTPEGQAALDTLVTWLKGWIDTWDNEPVQAAKPAAPVPPKQATPYPKPQPNPAPKRVNPRRNSAEGIVTK